MMKAKVGLQVENSQNFLAAFSKCRALVVWWERAINTCYYACVSLKGSVKLIVIMNTKYEAENENPKEALSKHKKIPRKAILMLIQFKD